MLLLFIKMLIANGVDVNAAKLDGLTSLMMASLEGHTDVVEALIAAGEYKKMCSPEHADLLCFYVLKSFNHKFH